MIVTGALLVSAGFNLFLIPHQLLSGGVSGVAMIAGYFTGWNIGWLYLIINVPILAWGFFAVGRSFVTLSILSVAAATWFMQLLPKEIVVQEPILGSVFGGVLVGLGSGLSLRSGGSTGGFDIIGSILTRKRDFPLGTAILAMNGIVILALGSLNNWDLALYSMLSIYVTVRVMDTVHVRHLKMTAFIVTQEKTKLLQQLLQLPRGVTVIQTSGAYTECHNEMLMTVTTRYELAQLRHIIRETDPRAFVNIVQTIEVLGEFRRI
ncbi:YitT family protein [Paenibacillus sp. y28]|uniref:YitT family protein n=1 Tax=Paenibacillus sp. y28 TaxID=3129110 RepID=UPI003018E433